MNPSNKTNSLTIKTPEGVEFSLQLAGPITRFLAWSVDFLVILVASELLNIIMGVVGLISRDFASAASIVGFFVISIGYGIGMNGTGRGRPWVSDCFDCESRM